ncbi:MAG: hypothetical protein RQ761_10410 [Bacteroidales bacterium]|nr:hypothetical protein [Bacteroidales bacterium]
MSDILIKYRPIPFVPVYRTLKRSFPDKWHELSQEQFMHLSLYFENPLPDLKDKIMLLKKCLDLRGYVFYGFDHYQVHMLLPLFDWMENIAFNKVFIERFNAGGMDFYGPKDGFENLSFDEFIVADTYFVRFLNSKDLGDLFRMAYALYRPMDPAGTRALINEVDLDQHRDQISKINPHLLLAIVFNYRIVRRWIEQAYPLVFPGTASDEATQKHQKKIPTPKWTKVRSQLAGDVIADIPRIGKLPLHTVLHALSERIKKSA